MIRYTWTAATGRSFASTQKKMVPSLTVPTLFVNRIAGSASRRYVTFGSSAGCNVWRATDFFMNSSRAADSLGTSGPRVCAWPRRPSASIKVIIGSSPGSEGSCWCLTIVSASGPHTNGAARWNSSIKNLAHSGPSGPCFGPSGLTGLSFVVKTT